MQESIQEPSASCSPQQGRAGASKDALSGLLSQETAEQYIIARLGQLGAQDACALFLVNLDDFRRVNESLGRQAGDRAIRRCAQLLSGIFCASDIVGRLENDTFLIFMSGRISEGLVCQRGEAVCRDLQLILEGSPEAELTVSAGIGFSEGRCSFSALRQSAVQALHTAKEGGKRSYCIRRCQDAAGAEDPLPVGAVPLASLLENMESGVALLEMGEPIRLLYVSPSYCRILDLSRQAYSLPRALAETVHPDDRLELERTLREGVLSGRSLEYTCRISGGGECWRWCRLRAVRIQYSNPYPVMMATLTDVSRYKEKERRLEETNRRLQIALEQTAQILWEVDPSTGALRIFDRTGKAVKSETPMRFPDWLLSQGYIHPSSAPRFREFAADLLSGRAQGAGNFIALNRTTGCYNWAAVSYRTSYGEDGCGARVVGIVETLPQDSAARKAESILHRPLPEALRPDLIVGMQANLTHDSVQTLWMEGTGQHAGLPALTCGGILEQCSSALFQQEDRHRYAACFSTQELLSLFREGNRWLSVEYQRVDSGGNIHWVSHIANLAEDPLTRDVHLFLYISYLDRRHLWEQSARGMTLHDGVTQLYTCNAARAMAQAILDRGGAGGCAAAMISLGGLCQLYAGNPSALDRARFYLACAFTAALGTNCLIALHDPEQILVFFPQAGSQHELRSLLEDAFLFVRLALAGALDLEGLRFVAGVVLERADSASFSAMASRSASLCQLWRSAAADTVAFPHEGDDWEWMHLQEEGPGSRVAVHPAQTDRPLSGEEKDAAFRCMSAMLSADTLSDSLHGVLSQIGSYYCADRVYILTLSDTSRMVTMPYEWTDRRKHSIQQAVSGTTLERYPLLLRCLNEKAPIFLTRDKPLPLRGDPSSGSWCFTAFPLTEKGRVLGFLCVENARKHPADTALFTVLIPYILRERERYWSHPLSNSGDSPVNPLGLPNLRSYSEAICALTSDRYSSMGALCLDIPNLSAINSSLGFEYGNRMLCYVSKALADIFGAGWVFRTWDAEFVAVCPNTTQQVFASRCRRLRSLLTRRYPRELRMGSSWASGSFQAKELVNKAKSILRGGQAAQPHTEDLSQLQARYRTVGEAAQNGRFTVYLQPQIDMGTGRLYGAEALVRGLDEDGTLIPPGSFIEKMEKSGTIRDLDLYVLDRALSLMEQWRAQGLEPIRISVNLSRITLFSPTALASVLAIQSRYPSVPPSALELEITESAGDVESSVLQATIDQFRQCGFHFSLDDFGSKYANLPIFTNVKFDTVKLDRSLIAGLAGNPINRMLIEDIIQICQTYSMTCIAEGVETSDQIDALMETGCHYAQGYFYDRPMPADLFAQKYLRAVPHRMGN